MSAPSDELQSATARWARLVDAQADFELEIHAIDSALRKHFEHPSSTGEISLGRRSYEVVPYLLTDVLRTFCKVPDGVMPIVVTALRALPDDTGFYQAGMFVNRTERRASFTSFWDDLHRHATSTDQNSYHLADAHCSTALNWSTRLCAEQGLKLFHEVTSATLLFRARAVSDANFLSDAYDNPAGKLGAPPSSIATSQRLSAEGRSMFYASSSVGTALAEIRAHNGWYIAVGRFKVSASMTLFDFRALDRLQFPTNILDPDYAERAQWVGLLRGISRELSTPSWSGDDSREYAAPQYLASYLARHAVPSIDGILYPSTQTPGQQFNVALFGGSALTEGATPALVLDPPQPNWVEATHIRVSWRQIYVARAAKPGSANDFPEADFSLGPDGD